MKYLPTLGFLALTAALGYIFFNVEIFIEADKVFLSVSTFLFSIFAGFFISRQASRYNKVREIVASFDGKLSDAFRVSGHIGAEMQKETGEIIKKHYETVLESGKWDYYFSENHSTTITSLHGLLDKYVGDEKVNNLKNQSIGAFIKALAACQDSRKQIVAIREERIPLLQWVLLYFFMIMLLITVISIPSHLMLFGSILKAAFVVSMISVATILHKLDSLQFSEAMMGELSARDVLGILDGTK